MSSRRTWDDMLPDFPERMACRIAAHRGNIFAVIDANAKVGASRYAQEIGLAAYGLRVATTNCLPIRSTERGPGLDLLCPVERVGPPVTLQRCDEARR